MKYTQEQLESMSDFEINKLVAIKLGHKCYYDNGSFTNGLCGSGVIVKGNGIVGEVNYCNSWADMGPIIEKNRILVRPFLKDYWVTEAVGVHNLYKNPLRAAAIVYLMMEG